jgi:hypothetical protein
MIAPPRRPFQDELEALIKEARERQLRRRLLGAAAVAVAAGLGLSVYALTVGGGTHGRAASGSPRGAAPACRSSQLSAEAIWDGGGGNLFNFFTIVNRGSGCSLPAGRPTVLLIRRGSPLKVDERTAPHGLFPGKPVHTLAPGRRAVVHLDWFNWCGPDVAFARTRTTVTVRFGDGLQVTVPHLLGQPPCMAAGQPSVLTVSPPLTLD